MKKILALFAVLLLLAAVLITAGCTTTQTQEPEQTPAAAESDAIVGEWVMNGYYLDDVNDKAAIVIVFNADNTFVNTEYLYQENSGDAQYSSTYFIGSYPGAWKKNSDGTYTITYTDKAYGEDTFTLKDNVVTDSDGDTYEKKTIANRATEDWVVGTWVEDNEDDLVFHTLSFDKDGKFTETGEGVDVTESLLSITSITKVDATRTGSWEKDAVGVYIATVPSVDTASMETAIYRANGENLVEDGDTLVTFVRANVEKVSDASGVQTIF